MNHVLAPLASAVIPEEKMPKGVKGAMLRHEERLAAKRRQHNIARFAEQAWGMSYCTVFFALGIVSLSTALLSRSRRVPISPRLREIARIRS
jgi:hypothetical protein